MTLPDIAFLLLAGVVAGVIGTAGGITSLVSYPALLAVGVPAYEASIANLGAGGVASALILTAAAPVPWTFVAVLAVGLLVGSLFGPILARRLPETLLRWAVAILGFTLAAILFVGSVG